MDTLYGTEFNWVELLSCWGHHVEVATLFYWGFCIIEFLTPQIFNVSIFWITKNYKGFNLNHDSMLFQNTLAFLYLLNEHFIVIETLSSYNTLVHKQK